MEISQAGIKLCFGFVNYRLFEGCSLYLFYLIDLLKVENDTHFPEDGNRNVLRIKAGEIMKALVLGTPVRSKNQLLHDDESFNWPLNCV